MATHAAVLLWSFLSAYLLRFDFDVPSTQLGAITKIFAWFLPLKLLLLYRFRQTQALSIAFAVPELTGLFYPLAIAALIATAIGWSPSAAWAPPLGVVVIDLLCSFIAVCFIRLAWRWRHQRLKELLEGPPPRKRRIGIIGAGEAGAMLAAELQSRAGVGLEPVAFFDDAPSKWFSTVSCIPILGAPELVLTSMAERLQLEEVIISLPSASGQRIRQIISLLEQAKLPYRTVPSLAELAMGKVQVSQLRPVEIQDLLGEPKIELDVESLEEMITGRVVMVTGAGGSIGGELCRQIATFKPERLILVERAEVQLFVIEQDLIRRGYHAQIVPCVTDVLDAAGMKVLLRHHSPSVIFHAAAHKHVPLMEAQPSEAIRNNAISSAQLAELAIECGVGRFILISTEAALHPTSVLDATKRLGEMYLQSLHSSGVCSTRFITVRFGNVLGSSGSVIPIFRDQIARGGPVTVTHPDVARVFMTLPETAGLILQAASQGEGGEIFLLDMGKPVKIVDMARRLIVLSGLEPDTEIKIEFVGLRPGEALGEQASYEQLGCHPTPHPKIRKLSTPSLPISVLRQILRELELSVSEDNTERSKMLLRFAVPEYQPRTTPERSP